MNSILFYSQIIVSVVLIVLVAIQQRGTALGAGFGGSGSIFDKARSSAKNLLRHDSPCSHFPDFGRIEYYNPISPR